MIRYYCWYILVLLSIAGCRKGDKVPAYIEIPYVGIGPTAGADTTTARITDVWVYANEVLLGTWEVPARIPILHEGPTFIQISPGVKRNGMYDDRAQYPFYAWWSGTVDLMKEQISVLAPEVNYVQNVDIWSESFSDAGFQLVPSEDSDTTLMRFTPQEHPQIVLGGANGTPAGGFVLDAQRNYMRLTTEEDFAATGGPMFLEMDYSTNVVLTVGVSFVSGGSAVRQPFVYLVPTVGGTGFLPSWNKVYIDLSPVFNAPASQRNFYFEATTPSSGLATVYLDNVKLVRNLP